MLCIDESLDQAVRYVRDIARVTLDSNIDYHRNLYQIDNAFESPLGLDGRLVVTIEEPMVQYFKFKIKASYELFADGYDAVGEEDIRRICLATGFEPCGSKCYIKSVWGSLKGNMTTSSVMIKLYGWTTSRSEMTITPSIETENIRIGDTQAIDSFFKLVKEVESAFIEVRLSRLS